MTMNLQIVTIVLVPKSRKCLDTIVKYFVNIFVKMNLVYTNTLSECFLLELIYIKWIYTEDFKLFLSNQLIACLHLVFVQTGCTVYIYIFILLDSTYIQIQIYQKSDTIFKLNLNRIQSNTTWMQKYSYESSSFDFIISSCKMSIIELIPVRYPSSWLPSSQGFLWSTFTLEGSGTVLPKSIIQTFTFSNLSCTNRSELPIICGENRNRILSFSQCYFYSYFCTPQKRFKSPLISVQHSN